MLIRKKNFVFLPLLLIRFSFDNKLKQKEIKSSNENKESKKHWEKMRNIIKKQEFEYFHLLFIFFKEKI